MKPIPIATTLLAVAAAATVLGRAAYGTWEGAWAFVIAIPAAFGLYLYSDRARK